MALPIPPLAPVISAAASIQFRTAHPPPKIARSIDNSIIILPVCQSYISQIIILTQFRGGFARFSSEYVKKKAALQKKDSFFS